MEINVVLERGFGKKIDKAWLKQLAGKILETQGVSPETELSIAIVGQEKIHQLNLRYLDRDEPTDVLSFSLLPEAGNPFPPPPDGKLCLGDIAISYPQAVAQSEEHKNTVKEEIALLLVHGILHLLGYDHGDDETEKAMKSREADILVKIKEELS